MKNKKNRRTAKNEVANAPHYTANLEKMLRQSKYASFIEEIQQKIQSAPNYLDDHWEETFQRTLSVMAHTGDLREVQPSEDDVEMALMAIVGRKSLR